MVCAALQAPLAYSRKPSANQAQTNAQIISSRTSVASEMARKPFCQLRKPFGLGAQTNFGSVSSHRDGLARSATPTALGAVRRLVRLPSHPPNPGRPCHGTFLGVH